MSFPAPTGAVILPLFCRDVRERRDGTGVLQRHSPPHHHSLLHTHHHGLLYTSVPQSSSLASLNGGMSTSLRGEGHGGASSRGANAAQAPPSGGTGTAGEAFSF